MKKHQPIKDPWVKSIISEEWRKAKTKIAQLGIKNKPNFRWGLILKSSHGICWGKGRMIWLSIKYRYRIRASESWREEFIETIRHEIVHMLLNGHGKNFIYFKQLLGGNEKYYASRSFKKEK